MSVAKKQSIMEELIKGCPKGHEVSNPTPKLPCKTKYIGDDLLVECKAENPLACEFSWFVGHFYVCRCPHYAHIAKEFKK